MSFGFAAAAFFCSAWPSPVAYVATSAALSPAAIALRSDAITVSGGAPASDCAFAIGSQIPLHLRVHREHALRLFDRLCGLPGLNEQLHVRRRRWTCCSGTSARPRASVSAAFLNWLSAAYAGSFAHEERRVGRRGIELHHLFADDERALDVLRREVDEPLQLHERRVAGVVLDGVVDDRQRERRLAAGGENVDDLRLQARVVRIERDEARERLDLLVLHLLLGVRVGRERERALVVLVDLQDRLADRDHRVGAELLVVVDLGDADARHDRVRIRRDSLLRLGERAGVVLRAIEVDALLGRIDLLARRLDGARDAASPRRRTFATSIGGSGCTMPSGRTSIMFAVTR